MSVFLYMKHFFWCHSETFIKNLLGFLLSESIHPKLTPHSFLFSLSHLLLTFRISLVSVVTPRHINPLFAYF